MVEFLRSRRVENIGYRMALNNRINEIIRIGGLKFVAKSKRMEMFKGVVVE